MLAALARMVKSDSSDEIKAYRDLDFPALCILLRDFDLDISESGFKDLNSWMEAVLAGRADGRVIDENVTLQVQQAITENFPNRQMLAMEPPTKQDKRFLKRIAKEGETGVMREGDFKRSFLDVAQQLLTTAEKFPKQVNGKQLDGPGMVQLIKRVVAGANGTDIDVDMGARSLTRGEFERIYDESWDQLEQMAADVEACLPMLSFTIEHKLNVNSRRVMELFMKELEDTGLIDPALVKEYHNKMYDVVKNRHGVIIASNTAIGLKQRRSTTDSAELNLRKKLTQLDQDMADGNVPNFDAYVTSHNEITEQALAALEQDLKVFLPQDEYSAELQKLSTVAEGHLLAHKADQKDGDVQQWRQSDLVPTMGDNLREVEDKDNTPRRDSETSNMSNGTPLHPYTQFPRPSYSQQRVPSREELAKEGDGGCCCKKCAIQ